MMTQRGFCHCIESCAKEVMWPLRWEKFAGVKIKLEEAVVPAGSRPDEPSRD